jgi:two-component system nitrate/nitrite response regulator NarL
LHLTIIDNSVREPLPLCRSLLEANSVGAIALISSDRGRAFFAEVCELETVSLIDSAASCDAFEAYLRLIAAGELILPYAMMESAMTARSVAPRDTVLPDTLLSTREWDVARSLVAGKANKLIARELQLSEATVKVHVKSILRKLQMANRTQVAIWASCTRTASLGLIAASVCASGVAGPLTPVA